jgi:hypothetical protein
MKNRVISSRLLAGDGPGSNTLAFIKSRHDLFSNNGP